MATPLPLGRTFPLCPPPALGPARLRQRTTANQQGLDTLGGWGLKALKSACAHYIQCIGTGIRPGAVDQVKGPAMNLIFPTSPQALVV
jgi:hypothetical protein